MLEWQAQADAGVEDFGQILSRPNGKESRFWRVVPPKAASGAAAAPSGGAGTLAHADLQLRAVRARFAGAVRGETATTDGPPPASFASLRETEETLLWVLH